jgi:hypothetical protein
VHLYIGLRVQVTNSVVRLPSPAKVPFGIDVIWLLNRLLLSRFNWKVHKMRDESKYLTALSSCLVERMFRWKSMSDSCLTSTCVGHANDRKYNTRWVQVTNSVTKLPSPSKTSFEIDVIWLEDTSLWTKHWWTLSHCVTIARTNSAVRLPRSAKVPLGIDVMLLEDRSLFMVPEWSANTWRKKFKEQTG